MAAPALISATAKALKLARNPVVENIPAYDLAGISDRTRLSYELEVYTSNGVSYTLATTLTAREQPATSVAGIDTYAGAYFSIEKILQAQLDAAAVQGTLGKYAADRIIQATGMVLAYYTVKKVYLDGIIEDTTTTPIAYAYNGSISEHDFAAYADTFFTAYIGTDGRFLSYKPNGTQVLPAAPEYLMWLHNWAADITTLTLGVQGYYTSGTTTATTTPLASLTSVVPMECYSIPVGADVVVGQGSSQLDAEDLIYYEVWLQNQSGSRVSEVRRYYYDATYHRTTKHLVFINSLGSATVVAATGQSATSLRTTRTEGSQFRGYAYEADIAATVVNDITGELQYTLRLTYARSTDLAYLADIGYTRQAYIIHEGKHIPVLPVTDSFIITDDTATWRGLELSFKQAYATTAFSALPAATATTARPTAWRPLATACALDSRGRYNGLLQVVTLELFYTSDGTSVQPAQVKPNTPGDAAYIPPVASAACALANTPYLNNVQSRTGTYKNQTCGSGLVGDYPVITIADDSWGSILSQADADAKALAEIDQLDTQAYANANGACNTVGVYTPPGGVPSGRWWLRVTSFDSSKTAGSGISADSSSGYRPGNMWFNFVDYQANQTDVDLNPATKLDTHWPVLSTPRFYSFYMYLQNNGDEPRTFRFFRNGLQVGVSTTSAAYLTELAFPAQPANGDTWYIDIN